MLLKPVINDDSSPSELSTEEQFHVQCPSLHTHRAPSASQHQISAPKGVMG